MFWNKREKPSGPVCDWLLAHKEEVLAGTANLEGTPVNDATELHQFHLVVSFLVVTFTGWSGFDLPRPANRNLQLTKWVLTGVSLLLGPWGFPFGPFMTAYAVFVNLRGGRKRTAASLLQEMEWGWEAPADASISGHRRKIVEVAPAAAIEIVRRRTEGAFRPDVAVRIMPTKYADNEVKISFDYPVSDGRDWVDSSADLLLLIDKQDEPLLAGCRVEFADGKFAAKR